MIAYRTPGVYFELVDAKRPSLVPLRTDIAGFVGIAAWGPLPQKADGIPVGAVKTESWQQFTTTFGGHIPQAYLAYAVEGFFANGGKICYVVRVADPERAEKARWCLQDARLNGHVLHLEATYPGVLTVSVIPMANGRFTLVLQTEDDFQEVHSNLSLKPGDPRHPTKLLPVAKQTGGQTTASARTERNGHQPAPYSRLVTVSNGSSFLSGCTPCLSIDESCTKSLGQNGLATLTVAHFGIDAPPDAICGLLALDYIDEVSLVAIPDIMPKPHLLLESRKPPFRCEVLDAEDAELLAPSSTKVERIFPKEFGQEEIDRLQLGLLAHCEKRKDRFAILDSRQANLSPDALADWRQQDGSRFRSTYGALYYPWLRVADPLRLDGLLHTIPPCGHVAGVYARVDNQVGVHKPPANEHVQGAQAVSLAISPLDHGRLNELGVNVLRGDAGRGIRITGARTLLRENVKGDKDVFREWGYVNVRRLLIMIAEMLDRQLQWVVMEPNYRSAWGDIERVVESCLHRLWRQGALDGETAATAYAVRCDETTNPPEEIERGRFICTIGMQPPWPAEFVVVRIGKTGGDVAILE
jgi:uncharacterized protein